MPVVLVAIFGLMVLKVAGLVLDGGYVFADGRDAARSRCAVLGAAELQLPGAGQAGGRQQEQADPGDITGSVQSKDEKKEEAPKPAAPAAGAAKPDGVVVNLDRRRRCRHPSARSWNGCSRAARSWRRGRARSRSARAC